MEQQVNKLYRTSSGLNYAMSESIHESLENNGFMDEAESIIEAAETWRLFLPFVAVLVAIFTSVDYFKFILYMIVGFVGGTALSYSLSFATPRSIRVLFSIFVKLQFLSEIVIIGLLIFYVHDYMLVIYYIVLTVGLNFVSVAMFNGYSARLEFHNRIAQHVLSKGRLSMMDKNQPKEFLAASEEKTKAMNKVALLLIENSNTDIMENFHGAADLFAKLEGKQTRLEESFEELFDCMMRMGGYKEILTSHNASPKDLCDIAQRLMLAGCSYQGEDFLPVALISFGKPLDIMLTNKDKIMNHSYKEVFEVVDEAKRYL